MDTTTLGTAAIGALCLVVLVALVRFRQVRFGLAWQDRGTLSLAASNDAQARHNIAIGRLESRDGSVDAAAAGSISGQTWRAANNVRLMAGVQAQSVQPTGQRK